MMILRKIILMIALLRSPSLSRYTENEPRNVDRIVGGSYVSITAVPYMLSFMLNGKHACGAAILDSEWGLTAAHCATSYRKDPYTEITIRSGSDRLNEGGVVHGINKIIWHEKYGMGYSDYDIAVFKVTPPFKFDNATQPVLLPTNYNTTDVQWGIVTGWGYFMVSYNAIDPVLSDYLEYVIVPKIPTQGCKEDYENRFDVTSRQVCYGFQQGGKDACKGDSGGPLVNLEHFVIGLTSWGDGCADENSPGVYTDVVLFNNWVREKMGI